LFGHDSSVLVECPLLTLFGRRLDLDLDVTLQLREHVLFIDVGELRQTVTMEKGYNNRSRPRAEAQGWFRRASGVTITFIY